VIPACATMGHEVMAVGVNLVKLFPSHNLVITKCILDALGMFYLWKEFKSPLTFSL